MKFLTAAVTICALGAVASAAVVEDRASAPADVDEVDEEMTALYNAGREEEANEEGHEDARRGGYASYPTHCYANGYAYNEGYWYGQCYCGVNGQWTCYKPNYNNNYGMPKQYSKPQYNNNYGQKYNKPHHNNNYGMPMHNNKHQYKNNKGY
jgi:hypothetical protein